MNKELENLKTLHEKVLKFSNAAAEVSTYIEELQNGEWNYLHEVFSENYPFSECFSDVEQDIFVWADAVGHTLKNLEKKLSRNVGDLTMNELIAIFDKRYK